MMIVGLPSRPSTKEHDDLYHHSQRDSNYCAVKMHSNTMHSYVALAAIQALTMAVTFCVLSIPRSQNRPREALEHEAHKVARQATAILIEFEKLVVALEEYEKDLVSSEIIAIKFQKEIAIYTKELECPLMGQEIFPERLELWRKAVEDWRKLIERDKKAIKLSRDNTLYHRRILELLEKMLQSKAIEDRRELIERKREIREYQKVMSAESGEIKHDWRLLGYERRFMECERVFSKCDLKLGGCERELWGHWDCEFKSWEDQRKLRKSERKVIVPDRMLLTHKRKSWRPKKGIWRLKR
jgi:tetratricopeptide (TPR) repeat protein